MTTSTSTSTADGRGWRSWLLSPVAAVVLAVLIIAGSTGAALALRSDDPGTDSVEAGFLRDMSRHHAQAVEMGLITYRRSTADDMVYLTYDIATTQGSQVGMMMATLDDWGLSQTGRQPQMAWMDEPHEGLMPGMATAERIDQLRTLPADQADVLFLQLMIVHHRAGVDMANALLDRSDNDTARRFATTFAYAQDAEITTMNQMLVARGQAPVDAPGMASMSGMDGMATPAATPGATPAVDSHDSDGGHGG